jgi:uncharacterized protein YigE (DUF2233 family)
MFARLQSVKAGSRGNAAWWIPWVAALLGALSQPATAGPSPGPCQDVSQAGTSYVVCTINLRTTSLKLHWKNANGEPYGTVGALARTIGRSGGPVVMAMNAGMYRGDGSPVGLYVENGQQLVKANTAPGPGNFHMKPNGVFYFSDQDAGVMDTARYLKTKPKADFATQSGPMLVIDGKLHPRFSEHGQSLKIRNGVGVRDAQTVIFAISNDVVSFGDFAKLFRDTLKCPNALFLDGSISSVWAPSAGRSDELWPAGPIISAKARVK